MDIEKLTVPQFDMLIKNLEIISSQKAGQKPQAHKIREARKGLLRLKNRINLLSK